MNMQEIVRALWEGHVPSTPLNGKPPRYSATTCKSVDASTNEGCERRHFFEQVVGIEPSMSAKQKETLAIGTRLHKHNERYYKEGKVPSLAKTASFEEQLAAKGLPLLPRANTPGVIPEELFEMSTWPGGPMFTGTADLVLPPKGFDPDGDAMYDFADLYDYKTTGNYPRYSAQGWALSPRAAGQTPDQKRKYLDLDVQNIAYARRVLLRFRAKAVRSWWIYYDKSGGPCVSVPALMERERTLELWQEKVLPLIDVMHRQHKERPSLKTVQPNEQACDSYGGCPHRAYCVDYKEKEKTMGKLSQQLLEGHTGAAVEKSTPKAKKEEAPALNPPALKKGLLAEKVAGEESPFALMDAQKEPKTEAPTTKATTSTSAPKAASTTPSAFAPATGGYALFIGCEPVVSKRPAVRLAKILAPLEERVAKANKVAHVGLVKYDAVHHTCAALDEWLQENGEELNGTNIIVGNSAFHKDVAERVLFDKAVAVAVGVS